MVSKNLTGVEVFYVRFCVNIFLSPPFPSSFSFLPVSLGTYRDPSTAMERKWKEEVLTFPTFSLPTASMSDAFCMQDKTGLCASASTCKLNMVSGNQGGSVLLCKLSAEMASMKIRANQMNKFAARCDPDVQKNSKHFLKIVQCWQEYKVAFPLFLLKVLNCWV